MAAKTNKHNNAEPELPSRRSFIKKLWFALGALLVAEIGWVVVEFLRPRKMNSGHKQTGKTVVTGRVEEFDPNTVTAFPRYKFYLARLADGGFLAMHRECTHLGCTVPWIAEQNRFICPCHASSFDITGQVLSPPAPRALDIYPVRIENGIVKVDTSRRTKRSSFKPGQVTRV